MTTINSVGLILSGSTGTGSFVGSNSPTLTSPTLVTPNYNFTWGQINNNGTTATVAERGNTILSSSSRTGTGVVVLTFSTSATNWLCVATAATGSSAIICTTVGNNATTSTVYSWTTAGAAVDTNFIVHAFPV